MISRLTGLVAEKTPSRIVVDVGGVGYDVLVPLSTFYVLGEAGTPVTLRIHTHVREDVIALYGFVTRLEQDLFGRQVRIRINLGHHTLVVRTSGGRQQFVGRADRDGRGRNAREIGRAHV